MIELSIDLGSSMTKIYRADTSSGVVLAEPSCVAVAGEDREIKAIGKEAKNLVGKTAEYTSIIYPIYEGGIANMRLAVEMLRAFLARIGLKGVARRRARIVVSIPCGASDEVLTDYQTLADECGLKKVYFIEQPYLCATGAGAVFSDCDPVFCLDIGGSMTNISVVSADGIIAGVSMNVGGNNMDANIMDRISELYQLKIGALTAEKIKNEICSLAPTARGTVVAEGSSQETLRPASASVQAEKLTDCIRVYVDKIIEYAGAVLRQLPAEVAATVHRNGVYLSGGVMKIPYVAQYVAMKLDMRFHVSDEPQFATVLGGGAIVRDKYLLESFAKKSE